MKAAIENYKERMQRIAIFDCLHNLERSTARDNSNNKIDYFSLGLLTLLFFFESMLKRNRKTGAKELAEFLYNINNGKIDLDAKGFEKLARSIIETFRPPGGKKNTRTFYNWETQEEDEVSYSILKASKSDLKSNIQYYTLDEQGLELVFATKEYFSEFNLSINQLLLRKQLEKGQFSNALRQIDEMRIDVETLETRISKLKYEVQRNILCEKTYERYLNLVEDIRIRLDMENNEFEELKFFINQTKDRLSYEIKDEKDSKTYEYIIKIQKELGEVHAVHRELLSKSINLKNTTLESARESIYYVGIDSFNFNKELVSRMFSSPLPLESSKTIIKPLLYLENKQTWSPLSVFDKQRVINKERAETNTLFEKQSQDIIKEEIKIQQKNYEYIMKVILNAKEDKQEITVEELVEYIKNSEYEKLLEDKAFYHFLIILHQKSPLEINDEAYEKEIVLQGVIELLKEKHQMLDVVETTGIVKANKRYSIKNMIIRLGDRDGLQ